ncbi:F-box-like domain superfamily [Sesbania bispinosa]|nr:F-box-like domain superfamily [Sesbania bispinosa]
MARRNDAPPPQPPFPCDLICEILTRLPVKSLMRFKCVCKQWKSLISDTHFAKLHLSRSTMDPTMSHHQLLLPTRTGQGEVISCSVKSLFNDPVTPYENVEFRLRHKYEILGTCNGLVCLTDYRNGYVRLWNPSTRLVSRKSPFMDVDDDEVAICHGFGYDCVSDKYRVVLIFPDPTYDNAYRTVTKVYTFGDTSWTTTKRSSFFGYPTNGVGKFVGGALNWVANVAKDVTPFQWVILSYDMEKEVFGQVLLPDFGDDKPHGPIPAVLKDCLCVCYDYKETHLVVWLMKEYGVTESWIKLMAIPHLEFQIFGFVPYIEPLCMSENDVVLVYTTFVRSVVYDSKAGRLDYPKIQSDKVWYEQFTYIESLVSPCF